jgi:hypothetical protein
MFDRRVLLKTGLLTALLPSTRSHAQTEQAGYDRFGGRLAEKFETNGFFRLEQRRRWWFVTPEGNAWLGFGVNHVAPGWLNQDYNRDTWLKRFGAERFNDAMWKAGLRQQVFADMSACGFNHFGVHNDHVLLSGLGFAQIPELHFVRIAPWMKPTAKDFLDVFAPEFKEHCEGIARAKVVPRRDDPWVLGWAFTDTPVFTDREAAPRGKVIHSVPSDGFPTWPRVLRNLPASAPGKQSWLAAIRPRYRDDLRAFNSTYAATFNTWDELLAAVQWRPHTDLTNQRELADNAAFLEQCVDRYYTTAVAAIRAHDPHHLIFGDKMNANTDGADAVLRITERHTDVVFYQMYGRWAEQRASLDQWRKITRKSFFNGDSSYAVTSEMMPSPYGPHARDQSERGEWTFEFAKHAFAEPDFVGWTVCGWVDTWRTMPGKEHKQHSGFFGPQGEPHSAYIQRLREASDRLYELALGVGHAKHE